MLYIYYIYTYVNIYRYSSCFRETYCKLAVPIPPNYIRMYGWMDVLMYGCFDVWLYGCMFV